MKKILFTISIFFIGLSFVLADTINFDYNFPYTDFTENDLISMIEEKRQDLIDYWQDNYSSDYPYYYIAFDNVIANNSNNRRLDLLLIYSDSIPTNDIISHSSGSINIGSHAIDVSIYCTQLAVGCKTIPSHSATNRYLNPLFYTGNNNHFYYPFSYYDSNFTLTFNKLDTYTVIKDDLTYVSYNNGDTIPTYRDTEYVPQVYTEINLNNYSYVILSLKSYAYRNDDNNQFFTNINTLGQLCLTSVYDYGMTEKTSIMPDYYPQQCSQVYNVMTPVPFYIIKNDLTYHSVYYLKAYNYSIENKVQVDSSIFNISYITSVNENNPTVTIDGRTYPTIPYNDLQYTAETSTDSNYISGKTCTLGDVNCIGEQTGINIDDLWTQPLKVLHDVWTSITMVFAVITEFILLIPSPLKEFLISAFFLSIVIGIIKIIV